MISSRAVSPERAPLAEMPSGLSAGAAARRLLPYFRPHVPGLLYALVAMAGSAGVTAGSMYILKQVIDRALMAGDMAALRHAALLVLGLNLLKGIFTYTHDYITARTGQSIVKRLRDEVYGHIHSLSLNFYTHTDSARIIARLTNDAQSVQNSLTKIPVMVVKDGLTALGLTGFLFYLHWRFALAGLIFLPVSAVLITRFGGSLRRSARRGQAKMADLYTLIQETVSGAAVVKAFGGEQREIRRFSAENQAFFEIGLKNARVDSLSSPVMEILGGVGLTILLWFGGRDVIDGVWTAGAFFAFIAAALSLYQPVKNFARANATLQLALSGAERLFQLVDERPGVVERAGAIAPPPFGRDIVFDRVSFFYRPDRPALEDISFTLRRGETAALVGPSGSGKTTLVSLLLRFYDPSAGRILLDGHDLRDVTLAGLRRQMGLVTQDTVLFNDTIRANIAYGRPGASEEDIVAAARAANAWEFIQDKPQGLDTMIGERGALLSGGQKQRLAIARAILKNPPILLLDEATSALDAQSERLVQEAVERLMKDRTALVIAHRLATVKNADRIVVLDAGRVVDMGRHAELLARGGIYRRLHDLQWLDQ